MLSQRLKRDGLKRKNVIPIGKRQVIEIAGDPFRAKRVDLAPQGQIDVR